MASNHISKIVIPFLVVFLNIVNVQSATTCYQCEGINCYRINYNKTEICNDPTDICVTIFEGFGVATRGCSLSIKTELRHKCDLDDDPDVTKHDGNTPECHKCNYNLCNDLGREDYRCITCDSEVDQDCERNPRNFETIRCPVPTTINSYCFVQRHSNKTVRGCATHLADQKKCYQDSENCLLCQPGEIEACNDVILAPSSSGNGNSTTSTSTSTSTSSSTSTTSTTSTTTTTTTTTTTRRPVNNSVSKVHLSISCFLIVLLKIALQQSDF